jgi:uncharacterized protein (DUF1015 family)
VPYDVVSTEEARALAAGNPLSFLHVSRAEIDLAPGTDPHADVVYQRAVDNFDALKRRPLVLEDEPSLYVYRLRMGDHEQFGLAGCYSLDEYERDVVKKHERTRRDKEDDRTRHLLALGAQTGPVFLVYRATATLDRLIADAASSSPLFDFVAADNVRHTLWQVTSAATAPFVRAVGELPALYIADGHHRAASAYRAWQQRKKADAGGESRGEGDVSTFLAVAFSDRQVQILPYNRIVRDLGSLSSAEFLERVGDQFAMAPGPPAPAARGQIAMYFERRWRMLTPKAAPDRSDPIASLDVSLLQDRLLSPILGIVDVRTDKRIDFVGGARGTTALERIVDEGGAAVAFSLHPVSVDDLMAVSDADAIMPPKSTWFEPKLRDGLLIHLI